MWNILSHYQQISRNLKACSEFIPGRKSAIKKTERRWNAYLAAYIINRYKTRFDNWLLLFPEHQKFWNFIKNSLRKLKNAKCFPRDVSLNQGKDEKCMIYLDLANVKCHQNRFSKFSLGKHFTFFQFSQWNFYEISKILMFWKEKKPIVKSSLISIYEICRKVRVPSPFRFFYRRFSDLEHAFRFLLT